MNGEVKERCWKVIYLDLNDKVNHYDFHDAQSTFGFHCDLEKDHEGMHSEKVSGRRIYWE